MAIKPDYQAGLATLAAGGTTVTFSGGANITAADIQPGDTFKVQNLDAIIASVTDATHVELAAPWTGTALTAAPYRIRFQPDGSRFTAALRDLVAAIGSGSVAALQALTGAADKIPYFTSAGVMALADFSANARATLANAKAWTTSLFGLTMAADKFPYGTGANTMGLADITAQGRGLIGATSVLAQLAVLGLPEQLAANRTYYVRKDGNDSNTGLADNAGGAFLTIQKAISTIYSKQDSRNFSNSIVVRAGTYAENLQLSGLPSYGGNNIGSAFPIFLTGDISTPANVVIAGNGSCLTMRSGAKLDIHGFKLAPTTSGSWGLYTTDTGTHLNFGNMNFGALTNADHMIAQNGSLITFDANYTISGGALNHYHADGGTIHSIGTPTVTLTGTPNFTGQFAGVAQGYIFLYGVSFSGTATGKKYLAHLNGSIRTETNTYDLLPGDARGEEKNGGRFDDQPSFNVSISGGNQTISNNNVAYRVLLASPSVNKGQAWDTTNQWYLPRRGMCSMSATVCFGSGLAAGNLIQVSIYKNGAEYKSVISYASASGPHSLTVTLSNEETDGGQFYQVFARADSAAPSVIYAGTSLTYFTGFQH